MKGRDGTTAVQIERATLEDLFVRQRLALSRIASALRTSKHNVRRHLRRYGFHALPEVCGHEGCGEPVHAVSNGRGGTYARFCRPHYLQRAREREARRYALRRERAAEIREARQTDGVLYEIRGLDHEGQPCTMFYGAGTTRDGVGPYVDRLLGKSRVVMVELYSSPDVEAAHREPRRTLVEVSDRQGRKAA